MNLVSVEGSYENVTEEVKAAAKKLFEALTAEDYWRRWPNSDNPIFEFNTMPVPGEVLKELVKLDFDIAPPSKSDGTMTQFLAWIPQPPEWWSEDYPIHLMHRPVLIRCNEHTRATWTLLHHYTKAIDNLKKEIS